MLKKGIISDETEMHFISYRNEEIKKIFSTLKLDISPEHKSQIVSELNQAKIIWESEEFFLLQPRPSIAKMQNDEYNAFIKIDNMANKLIKGIQDKKHNLMDAIAPLLGDRLTEKDKISKRMDKLICDLQRLSCDLKKPIAHTSKYAAARSEKTGRPPKIFRQEFILWLADIFEKVTRRKATIYIVTDSYPKQYNSPFFRFALECIMPIKKDIGNITLGKAIEKALKQRQSISK